MKKFIGWRKLIFAILLTVLASAFAWFKDVAFKEWSEFMIWIYGSYATTNVGEYFGKRLGLDKKVTEEDNNTANAEEG